MCLIWNFFEILLVTFYINCVTHILLQVNQFIPVAKVFLGISFIIDISYHTHTSVIKYNPGGFFPYVSIMFEIRKIPEVTPFSCSQSVFKIKLDIFFLKKIIFGMGEGKTGGNYKQRRGNLDIQSTKLLNFTSLIVRGKGKIIHKLSLSCICLYQT